jgi:voltage-gated potassium channel
VCADSSTGATSPSGATGILRLVQLIDDVGRFLRAEEGRHAILRSRVRVAIVATLAVDVLGTAGMYALERNARGSEIHSVGDAAFWSSVQLLTISSQLPNPVTAAGRVLDVLLELYAIVVVASLSGMFAAFFRHCDAGART